MTDTSHANFSMHTLLPQGTGATFLGGGGLPAWRLGLLTATRARPQPPPVEGRDPLRVKKWTFLADCRENPCHQLPPQSERGRRGLPPPGFPVCFSVLWVFYRNHTRICEVMLIKGSETEPIPGRLRVNQVPLPLCPPPPPPPSAPVLPVQMPTGQPFRFLFPSPSSQGS